METTVKQPVRRGYSRRNYNEDYFAEILTEEQAYWLGIIFGDGFLSPGKNTVGVSMAEQDKGHLCKMAISVGDTPDSIRTYAPRSNNWQVQRMVRLLFGRRRFFQSLVALGYGNRKADYSDFPPIPAHLLRHFIRGLFDADGYVAHYLSPGKYKSIARFRFSISIANEQLAHRLCSTLAAETGHHFGISRDHSIWAIRATNQQALRALFTFLYANATVFLERKRSKFEAAIAYSATGPSAPAA